MMRQKKNYKRLIGRMTAGTLSVILTMSQPIALLAADEDSVIFSEVELSAPEGEGVPDDDSVNMACDEIGAVTLMADADFEADVGTDADAGAETDSGTNADMSVIEGDTVRCPASAEL